MPRRSLLRRLPLERSPRWQRVALARPAAWRRRRGAHGVCRLGRCSFRLLSRKVNCPMACALAALCNGARAASPPVRSLAVSARWLLQASRVVREGSHTQPKRALPLCATMGPSPAGFSAPRAVAQGYSQPLPRRCSQRSLRALPWSHEFDDGAVQHARARAAARVRPRGRQTLRAPKRRAFARRGATKRPCLNRPHNSRARVLVSHRTWRCRERFKLHRRALHLLQSLGGFARH